MYQPMKLLCCLCNTNYYTTPSRSPHNALHSPSTHEMLSAPYIDCSPIPPPKVFVVCRTEIVTKSWVQLEKDTTYCTVDLLVNVRVKPLIVAPLVGLGQFEQVA